MLFRKGHWQVELRSVLVSFAFCEILPSVRNRSSSNSGALCVGGGEKAKGLMLASGLEAQDKCGRSESFALSFR